MLKSIFVIRKALLTAGDDVASVFAWTDVLAVVFLALAELGVLDDFSILFMASNRNSNKLSYIYSK
jgi:hypothetical protein